MRLYVPNTSPTIATNLLNGSVLVLIQFDVCEELRLDQLRNVKERTVQQQPSMKHGGPLIPRTING